MCLKSNGTCIIKNLFSFQTTNYMVAQLAGAVEYTNCTSTEGQEPPPNKCPEYDTKQSDGEVPVMLELWRMHNTPSLP